ncbi:hypothetical protein [Arthrobacter ramosus]|uniref:Uncharacterized protein n=1 Tax=Arthrobacter ramosus TaxID=1672 RepID=A0ABV5Y0Z2_ARTRM|nr:hypothetical protein [Arthrobacter ramosus]
MMTTRRGDLQRISHDDGPIVAEDADVANRDRILETGTVCLGRCAQRPEGLGRPDPARFRHEENIASERHACPTLPECELPRRS